MSQETEKKYEPISITLEPANVSLLDLIVKRRRFESRSEAIREALNLLYQKIASEPLAGAVYDLAGNPVFTGLINDQILAKIEKGELVIKTYF